MVKVEAHKNRKGLGIVTVYYRHPFEDMFETLVFSGMFESMMDADRLVSKINAAMKDYPSYPLEALDLSKWLWSASKASPFGFMHEDPVAKPYVIPESARSKALRSNYD